MMVKPQGSQTYNKLLIRTDIDSCSNQRGGFGIFFRDMIADFLKNYSNIKSFCPLDKGFYFVENFGVTMDFELPSFITQNREGNQRDWEATIELRGKVAKVKALVHGLTLKIYGSSKY